MSSANADSPRWSDLRSDSAKSDIGDDQFDRAPFAETLAKSLVLDPKSPSLVFALEGDWGSGKTTVINFVEYYLKKNHAQVLVVRLEAWTLASSDSVLQAFLNRLAKLLELQSGDHTLAKNLAQTARTVSRYIGLAGMIPGFEVLSAVKGYVEAGEGVFEQIAELAEKDLQSIREDLAAQISELKQPLIIIIDDLDRLDPKETRDVFRMIKSVLDFQGTSFLLAYAPSNVKKALSFDGVYDGSSYLEKIVQVAIPLPKPTRMALADLLFRQLTELGEAHDIADFEKKRLNELMELAGALKAIRHPRDLARLSNRLTVSVALTREEVNFADVVAFELLGLRFPGIEEKIRRDPASFTPDAPISYHWRQYDWLSAEQDAKKEKEERVANRTELWDELPKADRDAAVALIDFLFPGFSRGFERQIARTIQPSELRIARFNTLHTLLSAGPSRGLISARSGKEFLNMRNSRKRILAALEDRLAVDWFNQVARFAEQYKVEDAEHLADSIIDYSARQDVGGSIEGVAAAAYLLTRVIAAADSATARSVGISVCRNSKSYRLSWEFMTEVAHQHHLLPTEGRTFKEEPVVERKSAIEFQKTWLVAVQRLSQNWEAFFREPYAVRILFLWGHLSESGFENPQNFVARTIASDRGLIAFVEAWTRTGFEGIERFVASWIAFRGRLEECSDLPKEQKAALLRISAEKPASSENSKAGTAEEQPIE